MKKVITFIMAGGKGKRLWPLTQDRTKPAVPFGGIYRIIDFTLSNCLNSGLRQVYVLTQYKSASLEKHLRLGWNILSSELDEYIEVIPAQQRIGDVWYRGTADAIYQNSYIVKMESPEDVLILAGDHVYKMNYYNMIDFHRQVDADLTLAVIPVVNKEYLSQYGILQLDEQSRVISFQEKPQILSEQEQGLNSNYASMGIYVFKQDVLLKIFGDDIPEGQSCYDFGKDVIPKMLQEKFKIVAYNFIDEFTHSVRYWRDIGTIDAYFEANMDLLMNPPVFNLYDKTWPIRTYQEQFPPAKTVITDEEDDISAGMISNSLFSGGCIIRGKELKNSILSYNVHIDRGASVSESILMEGVNIGSNTKIKRAIIDKDVNVPSGMIIGYDSVEDKKHFFVTKSGIVVVAKKTEIK